MREHGHRHPDDVVGRHERPSGEPRRRARGRQQVHGRTRTRPELDRRQLARPAHDRREVGRDLVRDRRLVDQRTGALELAGVRDSLDARERRRAHAAVGKAQDGLLAGLVRVADVDAEEKAVELRLGQRVGALVLDRVLRRRDEERRRQRTGLAVDGDLALLHRLEERRLGLRRRAVDLVGEQHVRKDRPGAERKLARAQRHRARDVRGQHVGGELDAPELEPERLRERVHRQRLGDARRPLEQHVPAAGGGDERQVDCLLLPHDHAPHLGAHALEGLDHASPLRSLMRARPRAAASAAARLDAPCTIALASSSLSPAPRAAASNCFSPAPSGTRNRRLASVTTGAIAASGGPGAHEHPREAIGVRGAGGRERPRLRLGRPEAASAREHERRAGDAEQGERAAETARQRSPTARAAVAVHALDEGHRSPGTRERAQREGRVVPAGEAAVHERRGVGQQHRAPGSDARDDRQQRRPAADCRRSRAGRREASLDARRQDIHGLRLGQRSERARHSERRIGPTRADRARHRRATSRDRGRRRRAGLRA